MKRRLDVLIATLAIAGGFLAFSAPRGAVHDAAQASPPPVAPFLGAPNPMLRKTGEHVAADGSDPAETSLSPGRVSVQTGAGAPTPHSSARSSAKPAQPRGVTARRSPMPTPLASVRTGAPTLSPAPRATASVRPLRLSPAPRATSALTKTGPVPGRSVSGSASWFCLVGRSACTVGFPASCRCAAASGELQAALGAHWRGSVVRVSTRYASVLVTLADECACPDDRLIDLYSSVWMGLGVPLSAGIVEVTVSWP